MDTTNAILTIPGKQPIELPVKKGTLGPDVVDVSILRNHGVFTLDPGFLSTASCISDITFIDGEKGTLLHRGYPIKELAEKGSYLELCQLLLNGKLPSKAEHEKFVTDIKHHTMVHEQIQRLFNGFKRNAHPMAVLCSAVSSLSAYYHDSLDVTNPEDRLLAAKRLIAKLPTLAAMTYKYSIGQPFVYPDNSLSYSANLLQMMFSIPAEKFVENPIISRAIDVILSLHADHEQNASTSTVRLSGSSGANPFACISSGIASLWGPSHGGANEAVLNMLDQIGTPENISKFVAKAKDKNDPFRLMGFGHRVYKNFDPRATVMKDMASKVLDQLNIDDPRLIIARELEQIALKDEYFIEKKLYPNVDFYSGIILKAIGIPINMFTVMFAVGRTVGWISHWHEMLSQPDFKINRPRQLYLGSTEREFIELDKR